MKSKPILLFSVLLTFFWNGHSQNDVAFSNFDFNNSEFSTDQKLSDTHLGKKDDTIKLMPSNPKCVLKINPLSLILSTYNFQLETVVSKHNCLQFGFAYTNFQDDLFDNEYNYQGYYITLEFRNYSFSKHLAPNGFYTAPFLRLYNFNIDSYDALQPPGTFYSGAETIGQVVTFGGGLDIGFQHVFGNVFSLDMFVGLADYFNISKNISINNNPSNTTFTGPTVRAGISIGIAF